MTIRLVYTSNVLGAASRADNFPDRHRAGNQVPAEQLVLGPVNHGYIGRAFWRTRCGARSCRGWSTGCISGSRKGTAGSPWFSEPANKELERLLLSCMLHKTAHQRLCILQGNFQVAFPIMPADVGTRIVILDSVEKEKEGASEVLTKLTEGSAFVYKKEIDLLNIFLNACRELCHVVSEYEKKLSLVMNSGTPSLNAYIKEINELDMKSMPSTLVELEVMDLSALFKIYLLLVKSSLDKLIPLYSYRFFGSIKQFNDKGARFAREVLNNRHATNKESFVELVNTAKSSWLDEIIDPRDQYAHYSSLREYSSFTLILDSQVNGVKSICDFQQPTLALRSGTVHALSYMKDTERKFLDFARCFIRLCDYNSERRPKRYLRCDCGHEFAKKTKGKTSASFGLTVEGNFHILVMDSSRDYGVLVCPRCGRHTETDLELWRSLGAMQEDTN